MDGMEDAGIRTVRYKVAGHLFEVCARFPGRLRALLPSYEPFLGAEEAGPSPLFTFSFREEVSALGGEVWLFEWDGLSCLIRQDGQEHYFCIRPPHAEKPYVMHADVSFAVVTACLRGTPYDALVLNNFLMLAYTFSALRRGTLLLHAAAVAWQGKAYLFLGKSGTGKSTHARLWREHVEGSELLNDDNPVVRLAGGSVMAYGTPWSGKTPCYRDVGMPLGAFVRLEQGRANVISRRDALHGFAELLPSCFNMRWDDAAFGLLCDIVSDVAEAVPVYHFECLPDKEAALLSHKTVAR